MTTSAPLDIKVVFDAGSRSRSAGSMKRPALRSRHERTRFWGMLGAANLFVAFGTYYLIWWRVDPEIYLRLMLKTPVEMNLDMAAGIFVPSGQAKRPPPAPMPAVAQETSSSSFDARTAQWVIGTTAYGWLTLATTGACATALAGGAALRRAGGPQWKVFGWTATVLLLLGLGVAAYFVGHNYGRHYQPIHLRLGMGGLVLLAAALGLTTSRSEARLSRLAGVALILSAAGTVIALHLGVKAGALEPRYATASVLAAAFSAYSAYGWLLLTMMWRLAR